MSKTIRIICTALYTATAISLLSGLAFAQAANGYFIVKKSLGVSSVQELDGASLCIGERWLDGGTRPQDASAYADNALRKFNVSVSPIASGEINQVLPDVVSGRCDLLFFVGDYASEEGVRSDIGSFETDGFQGQSVGLKILHIERF